MTIQVTENLIFNGEKMDLQVSSAPKLPTEHPSIIETGDGYAHSACWRRYVGTWAVKEGKLFLVELRGQYTLDVDTPIVADWFTGTIVAPQGEVIYHPGHIGECLYEADLRITIENGHVVSTEIVDNQNKLKALAHTMEEYDIPAFLRMQAD